MNYHNFFKLKHFRVSKIEERYTPIYLPTYYVCTMKSHVELMNSLELFAQKNCNKMWQCRIFLLDKIPIRLTDNIYFLYFVG